MKTKAKKVKPQVLKTVDGKGRLNCNGYNPSVIDNKRGCLQFHEHGKLHSDRTRDGFLMPSVVWHNGHLEFHKEGKPIAHPYTELLPAKPTLPFVGEFTRNGYFDNTRLEIDNIFSYSCSSTRWSLFVQDEASNKPWSVTDTQQCTERRHRSCARTLR